MLLSTVTGLTHHQKTDGAARAMQLLAGKDKESVRTALVKWRSFFVDYPKGRGVVHCENKICSIDLTTVNDVSYVSIKGLRTYLEEKKITVLKLCNLDSSPSRKTEAVWIKLFTHVLKSSNYDSEIKIEDIQEPTNLSDNLREIIASLPHKRSRNSKFTELPKWSENRKTLDVQHLADSYINTFLDLPVFHNRNQETCMELLKEYDRIFLEHFDEYKNSDKFQSLAKKLSPHDIEIFESATKYLINEQKHELFEKWIRSYFSIHRIPGDNSCLFRSLAREIKVENENGFRNTLVTFMEERALDYMFFVGSDDLTEEDQVKNRFKEYCQDMKDDKTWGDEVEIRAFVDFCELQVPPLHVKVTVLDINHIDKICIDDNSLPTSYMVYENNGIATKKQEIYLYRSYDSHYDLLEPKSRTCS